MAFCTLFILGHGRHGVNRLQLRIFLAHLHQFSGGGEQRLTLCFICCRQYANLLLEVGILAEQFVHIALQQFYFFLMRQDLEGVTYAYAKDALKLNALFSVAVLISNHHAVIVLQRS